MTLGDGSSSLYSIGDARERVLNTELLDVTISGSWLPYSMPAVAVGVEELPDKRTIGPGTPPVKDTLTVRKVAVS